MSIEAEVQNNTKGIASLNQATADLKARADRIEDKIPGDASQNNKLVDKQWVEAGLNETRNALNQKPDRDWVVTKVSEAIGKIVDGAPEVLDTLKEVADWIARDETGTAALLAEVARLADELKKTSGDIEQCRSKVDRKLYDKRTAFLMVSCTVPSHGYGEGGEVGYYIDGDSYHLNIMDNENFVDVIFTASDNGPGRYELTSDWSGYTLVVDRVDNYYEVGGYLATSNDLDRKQDLLTEDQMSVLNSQVSFDWVQDVNFNLGDIKGKLEYLMSQHPRTP